MLSFYYSIIVVAASKSSVEKDIQILLRIKQSEVLTNSIDRSWFTPVPFGTGLEFQRFAFCGIRICGFARESFVEGIISQEIIINCKLLLFEKKSF